VRAFRSSTAPVAGGHASSTAQRFGRAPAHGVDRGCWRRAERTWIRGRAKLQQANDCRPAPAGAAVATQGHSGTPAQSRAKLPSRRYSVGSHGPQALMQWASPRPEPPGLPAPAPPPGGGWPRRAALRSEGKSQPQRHWPRLAVQGRGRDAVVEAAAAGRPRDPRPPAKLAHLRPASSGTRGEITSTSPWPATRAGNSENTKRPCHRRVAAPPGPVPRPARQGLYHRPAGPRKVHSSRNWLSRDGLEGAVPDCLEWDPVPIHPRSGVCTL